MGHRFSIQALGSPYGGPFNCLIVGHSPGFNCMGPQRASKNTHSNFSDYTSPFYFQELIGVIISPPITPNKFWGFNKRNSLEKIYHLVLPLLGKLHNLLHQNSLRELISERVFASQEGVPRKRG